MYDSRLLERITRAKCQFRVGIIVFCKDVHSEVREEKRQRTRAEDNSQTGFSVYSINLASKEKKTRCACVCEQNK